MPRRGPYEAAYALDDDHPYLATVWREIEDMVPILRGKARKLVEVAQGGAASGSIVPVGGSGNRQVSSEEALAELDWIRDQLEVLTGERRRGKK